MVKHFLILTVLLGVVTATAVAQPKANLAANYLSNAEFDKAEVLYEELCKESPNNDAYFINYLACLNEQQKYPKAEEVLKKKIKAMPRAVWLHTEYGQLLERMQKPDKADDQYKKALADMPAEDPEVMRLADAFVKLNKLDYAEKAYEKGGDLLKDKYRFSYQLADVYRQNGNIPKMVDAYLNSIEKNPNFQSSVESFFQRANDPSQMTELQNQLIDRSQQQPDITSWPDMLAWVYMQKQDYKNAFRQLIALDKRENENGVRVYRLAVTAKREKAYSAALEGFQYIIDKKGSKSPFYPESKYQVVDCRREQIEEGFTYTHADLLELEGAYESYLQEFGKNKQTVSQMLDFAKLEAFYINNLDKAIAIMQEVIALPFTQNTAMTDAKMIAQAKLDLADYYLMKGDEWESTLLYSQVDKMMKDAPLGELARFKNAKLSYYQGEFDWAQGQLGALKASTTELISNDAIDLSVFITEHYGLDTTPRPMQMFAHAELLNFQNRFDEAFVVMDSIDSLFPKHNILDHIDYVKAEILIKKKQYAKAVPFLNDIIEHYKEGILVDNAIFMLAQLYANPNQLNDQVKAKGLYERIITEFSSSIFVIEARKQFRRLRGDKQE